MQSLTNNSHSGSLLTAWTQVFTTMNMEGRCFSFFPLQISSHPLLLFIPCHTATFALSFISMPLIPCFYFLLLISQMEINSEDLKVSHIVLHSDRDLAKKVLSSRTDFPPFGNITLSRNQQVAPSYLNATKCKVVVGGTNLGFLDGYSGKINKPQVSSKAHRGPEQTCHPLCFSMVFLLSLLCARCCTARRRRCGGRRVSGWGTA